MIRQITRPTTAKCTLSMYMGFLIISEPNSSTCTRLEEVTGISHDSVNRFLEREKYEPKDLFNEGKNNIFRSLKGGTVSIDDSVLDKPYSKHMSFVSHFWSGKHHKTVKGINLITLYYTDPQGFHAPINYRIYDKSECKTKNDYFQEMLNEVLSWGLKPKFVTGDSWYSGVPNLKTVKDHCLGFMFAIESNRIVSLEKGSWQQVRTLDIPENGLIIWLKSFGQVKVFRKSLKNQQRHYIVFLPNTDTQDFIRKDFLKQHDNHWKIEQYHRAIKQVCHVERFQVRNKRLIRNHVFAALYSFLHLQKMCAAEIISNCYKYQKSLYKDVVAVFINCFKQKDFLKPYYKGFVNA